MICYLRLENDTLEDAQRCSSLKEAIRDFKAIADDLARFGQEIDASVYFGEDPIEYPDRYLTLGPRGGVQIHQV